MEKTELRQLMRKRLIDMAPELRRQKSKKACQNLIDLQQFKQASVVMVYLALPHEVDTTAVMIHAWQSGKIVAVPKVSWQQRHMIPVEINSLETGFDTERHGLRNPTTGQPVPVDDIDIVIAPGLAFDRSGNRLGRGGAYFDRFFAAKELTALKVALAFSEQLVEQVPMESHDQRVDMIVTDQEVIDCRY